MNWLRSFLLPSISGYLYYQLETLSIDECELIWYGPILKLIFDHKSLCGTILFFLSGSFYVFLSLGIINRKRKMIYEVLNNFLKSLGGDSSEYRITLFEVCSFWTAIFYFMRSTFMNIRYFIRKKCLKFRLSTFPIPVHKYLRVYQRAGRPNKNKRSSLFIAPKNDREIDGMAPMAYYKELPCIAKSLNLDSEKLIEFSKLSDVNPPGLKSKVNAYMNKTGVKNFNRLKLFRKISGFILAIPLYCTTEQKNPSHVLVLDGGNKSIDINDIDDKLKVLSDDIGIIIKS